MSPECQPFHSSSKHKLKVTNFQTKTANSNSTNVATNNKKRLPKPTNAWDARKWTYWPIRTYERKGALLLDNRKPTWLTRWPVIITQEFAHFRHDTCEGAHVYHKGPLQLKQQRWNKPWKYTKNNPQYINGNGVFCRHSKLALSFLKQNTVNCVL